MRILSHAFDMLLTAFGVAAGVVFALLAVAISLDVVLRNIGIISFPWLLEVTEYALYGATFLAAPWILREGRHVRVDVFVEFLPVTGQFLAALFAEGFGFIASALLGWYAGRVTLDAYSRGELLFKELVIPEWWLLIVLPISSALMLIEFGRRIHTLMSRGQERPRNAPRDGL